MAEVFGAGSRLKKQNVTRHTVDLAFSEEIISICGFWGKPREVI
jgi:hypothetical protein